MGNYNQGAGMGNYNQGLGMGNYNPGLGMEKPNRGGFYSPYPPYFVVSSHFS